MLLWEGISPKEDQMKTLAIVLITTLFGFGAVALAGPPVEKQAAAPGECVQAGISTLKSLEGGIVAAAKQEVNYADFDSTGLGLIDAEFGEEYFAPLGAIVKLHVTSPELFAWCSEVD